MREREAWRASRTTRDRYGRVVRRRRGRWQASSGDLWAETVDSGTQILVLGVQRDGGAGRGRMSQQGLHDIRGDAAPDPLSRPGVPHHVRAGAEPAALPDPLDDLLGVGVGHGTARIAACEIDEHVVAAGGFDHPLSLGEVLAIPVNRPLRQRHHPMAAGFRAGSVLVVLAWSDVQVGATSPAPEVRGVREQMHILPPQSERLADPEPACHENGQQQPVAGGVCGFEDLTHLMFAESGRCQLDLWRFQDAGLDHQVLAALAWIEAGRDVREEARFAEPRGHLVVHMALHSAEAQERAHRGERGVDRLAGRKLPPSGRRLLYMELEQGHVPEPSGLPVDTPLRTPCEESTARGTYARCVCGERPAPRRYRANSRASGWGRYVCWSTRSQVTSPVVGEMAFSVRNVMATVRLSAQKENGVVASDDLQSTRDAGPGAVQLAPLSHGFARLRNLGR